MPLYIDRHEAPPPGTTISSEDVYATHDLDLSVQDKHGVRFLGGLVDPESGMAFCICEAPSPDSVEATHREAHGNLPSKVLEIDHDNLTRFLGLKSSLDELGKHGIGFRPTLRTILFTDIEEFTDLTRRLGDERAFDVRSEHDAIIRSAVDAAGGSLVKSTGDGMLACFQSVAKALECAIAIQRGVASVVASTEAPIRVRAGLAAGEPVATGDDLFGLAVNLASRVCDACEPGAILVTSAVRELAAGKGFNWDDAGEHSFKGFDEPQRVYRLRWS